MFKVLLLLNKMSYRIAIKHGKQFFFSFRFAFDRLKISLNFRYDV